MTKPKPKAATPGITVKDSSFIGGQWDAKAVDAIQTIADSLLEQARASHALVGVFASQHIAIDCMLKIDTPKL